MIIGYDQNIQEMNLESTVQYLLVQGEAEVYFQVGVSRAKNALAIQAEYPNDDSFMFFQKILSIEDLRKMNQCFDIISKIDDCFFIFKTVFDQKDIYIKELTNDRLTIVVTYNGVIEFSLNIIHNPQGFQIRNDIRKIVLELEDSESQNQTYQEGGSNNSNTQNINSMGNYNYSIEENLDNGNNNNNNNIVTTDNSSNNNYYNENNYQQGYAQESNTDNYQQQQYEDNYNGNNYQEAQNYTDSTQQYNNNNTYQVKINTNQVNNIQNNLNKPKINVSKYLPTNINVNTNIQKQNYGKINTNNNSNMNSNINVNYPNNPPKLNLVNKNNEVNVGVNIQQNKYVNSSIQQQNKNIRPVIQNNPPKIVNTNINANINTNIIKNNNTSINANINTNIVKNNITNNMTNIIKNINTNIMKNNNTNVIKNKNTNVTKNNNTNNTIINQNIKPQINMPKVNINVAKPKINYSNEPKKINLSVTEEPITNVNINMNSNNIPNPIIKIDKLNNYPPVFKNQIKIREDEKLYEDNVEETINEEEVNQKSEVFDKEDQLIKSKEEQINECIEKIRILKEENEVILKNLKEVEDENKSLTQVNTMINNQLNESTYEIAQLKKKYERERDELQDEILVLTTVIGKHDLNQELIVFRNNYKTKNKAKTLDQDGNKGEQYDDNDNNKNYNDNNYSELEESNKYDTSQKSTNINFRFYKTLTQNSYIPFSIDKTFVAFKSFRNELLLVYPTKIRSMECYDLVKQKVIRSIPDVHRSPILNIRHGCIKVLSKDFILTCSNANYNLKMWDIETWTCFYNIEQIYSSGNMFSMCMLFDVYKNQSFVFTSNDSDNIKIYNENGKFLQNLSKAPNYETFFIDIYNDEEEKVDYLVSGDMKCVRVYELAQYNLSRTYYDQTSVFEHVSACVYNDNGVKKLIEGEFNGFLRVWNFITAVCLFKISVCKRIPLVSLCMWNLSNVVLACSDCKIRMINLANPENVKTIGGHNNEVVGITKIIHPTLGECLLTQGIGEEQINLWISS